MTQIKELAKYEYNEIVKIVTSTEEKYDSELKRMGSILAVCEHFDMECNRIEGK